LHSFSRFRIEITPKKIQVWRPLSTTRANWFLYTNSIVVHYKML